MALLLTACTQWLPDAHKLDITQGNVITPDQVNALNVGMPKAEIRRLLGEPVLQDPFNNQRWDYILRYSPSEGETRQSRLTLHFADDLLRDVDDSQYVEPETLLPPPSLEN